MSETSHENINIDTTRHATVPESPPWELEPQLLVYGLKTVNKIDTIRQFVHVYTDGSNDAHEVECAVVSNLNIIKRRLHEQASIYS